MHENSMKLMSEFADRYYRKGGKVLDMGSSDLHGGYNYKHLFPGAQYSGADIVIGLNVDVIVGSPEWDEIRNVDLAISGQTLEHVADIPAFMTGIFDKLKPGGTLCMIAPSAGPEHHYPAWMGHFSAERMAEVVMAAGFEIIECTESEVEPFRDTRCIARKPGHAKKARANADQ